MQRSAALPKINHRLSADGLSFSSYWLSTADDQYCCVTGNHLYCKLSFVVSGFGPILDFTSFLVGGIITGSDGCNCDSNKDG